MANDKVYDDVEVHDMNDMHRDRKTVKTGDEQYVFFFKQKTAYEIPLCDWSSDV